MGSNDPINNKAVVSIVRMAMVPFVRLLLRYGVSYVDFTTIVKRIYVEVAERDFQLEGRQQSVARVSVLTGLTRREVKRISTEPAEEAEEFSMNRAGRVAAAWIRDDGFLDAKGQPVPLAVSGEGSKTFAALVKKYGGDIPARPVMDELLRLGVIRREGDELNIASTGYVPSDDSAELLKVAFRSVGDLIGTIDCNDQGTGDERLQLTVAYDNVSEDGAEAFRILSREKSKELLIFLDRFLATQDRDTNPSVIGDGEVRSGLGIYFFKDESKPESEEE